MNWKIIPFLISVLFLAAGCSSPNGWQLDEIAAGDRLYDSSRLRYVNPEGISPLSFELLRIGDQMEAFLSLSRSALSPSDSQSVRAVFRIDGEEYEEEIPFREGGMRVRLSLEMAGRLTQALQEEKNVGILIDGFEENLTSGHFSDAFRRFLGNRSNEKNLFKGYIE